MNSCFSFKRGNLSRGERYFCNWSGSILILHLILERFLSRLFRWLSSKIVNSVTSVRKLILVIQQFRVLFSAVQILKAWMHSAMMQKLCNDFTMLMTSQKKEQADFLFSTLLKTFSIVSVMEKGISKSRYITPFPFLVFVCFYSSYSARYNVYVSLSCLGDIVR